MAGEPKGKSEAIGHGVDSSSTSAETHHENPAGRVTQTAGRLDPTPETLDDLDLPPRFEVRRIIGIGAMGVVVEVFDRNLGREVAVKLLKGERKNDPVYRIRFRREAEATAGLRHPNIVTVHDVDFERDFIVMELIHGESLQARLRRGRLRAEEVRRLGLALLDALGTAHDANIVHRDVKPANILLDTSGVVKLVDFGIALFGDRELTESGVRIGTPAYMAPEQLRGRVADARADIYAVGATLFEVATGIQLHTPTETARLVANSVFEATNDPALASAIERAVAELPEDRFANARAFAEALSAPSLTQSRPRATTIPGSPPPSAGPASRSSHARIGAASTRTANRRSRLAVGGVAVVLVAAIAGLAALGRDLVGSKASSKSAPELHVIAVLPFEDHTQEPRLDFASSGLPHILASELKPISGLKVVGYYDLLDRLQDPAAPVSAWAGAARSLGADVIVRGELFAEPSGIRILVEATAASGEVMGRVERMTTVDSVPAATRSAAGDVARIVFGRPTPTVAGETRQFDVERYLQLGIAALERQDFTEADSYLAKAELEAPDLAEVYYYRAVLNWWLSRDVSTPVTRALAGNLDEAQRGFLEGLLVLIDQSKPTESIVKFRALATQFPGDRDIEYGLFEALFHGDRPAEAMVVYRRLGEQRPRFRLGLKHALGYYFGHGNVEGMAWARARFDAGNREAVLWQARALIAQRDYPEAIALLRRHEADGVKPTLDMERELAQVYMLDGQVGLAVDTATHWSNDVAHTAADLLGLAKARGLPEEAEWSRKAAYVGELATVEDRREHGCDLAAIELPEAIPARLRRIAAEGPPRSSEVGVVLIAGAVDDRAIVEQARSSPYPEVVAVADAYVAEWAADWSGAAAAWGRAIEAAADGNFLIVEWLGAARARRAANDQAAVLVACDEVIRPRRFTWAWGGAVGPCLRWSAEAASALGRTAEAKAYWNRLLALRSAASSDDALASAARAALGTSP